MSRNLDLLRQNYCWPTTDSCKTIPYLFLLERECDQGSAFLAKAPERLLHFQELDPSGLEPTYIDQATGAQLPVFAIFNLAGSRRNVFEITATSDPTPPDRTSILAHIPFKKAQAFVRKMNEHRIKTGRVFTLISVILGIILGPVCLFPYTGIAADIIPWVVIGGSTLGALFGYILADSILDWRCPWQKLVLTAEFDGILPSETRKVARIAKDHFDNLYLVVDQQNQWKSAFLPDPSPRIVDPLLIGELKEDHQRRFFLIDQFEVTAAEQYLADECVTMPD